MPAARCSAPRAAAPSRLATDGSQSGARLLFYTDGLIERRRQDIAEGFSALADAMRRAGGLGAERTCAAVQRELLRGITRADDVCLLAVRLTR